MLAIDTVSSVYGSDGFTFCGPRSYSITSPGYSALVLTLDILTLQSIDILEATPSPITITITAILNDYSSVTSAL